jgi:molybdate transport system substrate-binding protein
MQLPSKPMQSLHDFMPSFNPAKRQFLRRSASVSVRLAVATSLGAPWLSTYAKPKPQVVRIAAASDLKFALAHLIETFERQTGVKVELSFGSSGNFARQILQGLPVDIFMSADEDWAFKVAEAGLTHGGPVNRGVVYAQGRLALIVPNASPITLDEQLKGLQAQWSNVRKFAIANPELAPYGRAAQQALQKLGLWDTVQTKLVIGENIAQATQFVISGAAQAGITALSLATAPELAAVSKHIPLPAQLHAPLRQRMVLLKNPSAQALALYDHLQGAKVSEQLKSHGFDVK